MLEDAKRLVILFTQATPLALMNLITFVQIQIEDHRGGGWLGDLIKKQYSEHSITLPVISQAFFIHMILFHSLFHMP